MRAKNYGMQPSGSFPLALRQSEALMRFKFIPVLDHHPLQTFAVLPAKLPDSVQAQPTGGRGALPANRPMRCFAEWIASC